MPGSSGIASAPVSLVTSSGGPEWSTATTGVPQARDSISTSPNASWTDGRTVAQAATVDVIQVGSAEREHLGAVARPRRASGEQVTRITRTTQPEAHRRLVIEPGRATAASRSHTRFRGSVREPEYSRVGIAVR